MIIRWIKSNLSLLMLLAVCVLTLYLPFSGNAFLSDDLPEIKNNPQITSFSYVLSHPSGFIRPLVYFLTYNIFGLNPVFFRLFNIILHMVNTWLVFALLSRLHKKSLAFFAAMIFAVHPLLTEPVLWISGGLYPQYTLFFLTALLFYILSSTGKKSVLYWTSVTCFFLALESHMIAITLPAVIFIYEMSLGDIKKNWLRILPFGVMSLLWIGLSFSYVPERSHTLQTVHYQQSSSENPAKLLPIAVTEYLKLIIWPEDLTLYHSELNFSTLQFIWRVIITMAIIGATLYAFFKNKAIFFWLSFFLINLIPTITTATFRLTWIVAERYSYLASIGIIAALLVIIEKYLYSKKYRNIIYGVLTAVIILLSVRSIFRSIDWINEDNLWIATGRTSPSSPNTHNNLGDMYGRHKDYYSAIKEFETAIVLKPDYADAYHNLGNTYNEIGEKNKALELYTKAAELNPILWQSRQNIAALYFEQGKYDLAIEQLQKAISISPTNLGLYMNLGVVYLKQGDKPKAKEIFNQILQNNPTYQPAQLGFLEASK